MILLVKKILRIAVKHKVSSGFIALVIAGIGYWTVNTVTNTDGETRYVLAAVQKGTLIVSISGSGQVSASNQVDIKPKASGDVAHVAVKNGQEVKAGTLIVQLNARDAQKAVRDALANLESAKLSLEKLKKPADTLSVLQAENALKLAAQELEKLQEPPDALELLQAENALAQAKESKQKSEDDLKKSYDDGFNAVANAFLDFPGVMTGLDDTLFDNTISSSQANIDWYANQTKETGDEREKALRYRNDIFISYNKARSAYAKNFDNYKAASRASDTETIETLILETYEAAKIIADAIKTADNYIDFIQDSMEKRDFPIPSQAVTHQSNLNAYTGTTNSHLASLLSVKSAIQTNKENIVNADRTIAERQESLHTLQAGADQEDIQTAQDKIREKQETLSKLKAGADTLDIQSAELTMRQRGNALLDAREKLADYYVRAPFDGIIAQLDAQKGDSVSPSTILGTLITKQKIAEISLNEVDVAQIQTDQKATLTFDAVPELSISGQVASIDTVGTVSQGVVTYTVEIAFDTQDDRVKPAMSVSAAIIIDAKPDVLLVPVSAVKQEGNVSYVEIPNDLDADMGASANTSAVILKNPPRRQIATIGLLNDESAEITSGLKEGDRIIARTIQTNLTENMQTQGSSSGFRFPGAPGSGGGGGGSGFRAGSFR